MKSYLIQNTQLQNKRKVKREGQYTTNWICQIPQVLQPSLIKKHLLTPFPNSPTQKKTCSPSPTNKKTHMFQSFKQNCFSPHVLDTTKSNHLFCPTTRLPTPGFLTKKRLAFRHLCPGVQVLGARHGVTELRIPKPRHGFADIRHVVRKIQGCRAQHQGQHQRQESTQQCKSA